MLRLHLFFAPPCLLPAVVPPGYYFDANNTRTVKKCPDGSFRADWLNANDLAAQSCISCGLGVKAVKTDLVKAYNVTDVTLTWFEEVTTSSDDCCEWEKPCVV